ncbi:protein translocase subunit SecD [Pararobbsia alpina]|uniref:Protein translocase subunit SecD n=1 Tax=Pararobbsia alpina TaxID=621374 RepID=A0A6S7AU41_9BURK|nr:protein translocase subunit SecD [Pararobbsia alpina]CAB3777109.1 Protein translocase subunit SecD [Pararobbsia alpina]
MNRYPLWKYLVMLVALAIGLLYTLPNFFGEAPAVQISSGKATAKVDSSVLQKVEDTLSANQLHSSDITFDNSATSASIRVRLASTDEQLHARDVLAKALNTDQNDPTYVVALNLQSKSPKWLSSLHALPMYLGLDLRGGVHFLLQVDMQGALAKRLEADATDARNALRDKEIRDGGVNRTGSEVVIDFADAQTADQARAVLLSRVTELQWATRADPQGGTQVVGTFSPAAERTVQENALKQNMSTLHNRVNELGVAEPVIQQQGPERIVVELPGVQDTAKAKSIIGRTATLEARLADPTGLRPNPGDPVPPGDQLFTQGNAAPVLLRKQVIFTGDQITDAGATFDEHQRPAVKIRLNSAGGRILRDVSRDNIGKPMAIVLFERGSGEVLTVATIQSELGENFQITGAVSTEAANDLALLLRAGSLAAPMNIIEERTIGPSLGADNIRKGFDSVQYGFAAIALFMLVYYMLFGAFSVISLSVNLLLLVAVLSLLQATLTLPGIAAIALALGMAIDSNVLINERIREELRRGAAPQTAISEGFRHAWATILDSNVTTLIAGIALLAFGSGPVRGFAMVHCIGILTSMFSAVFFSRGLVNLWYGGKKRLKSLAIGQVWRPEGATPTIDQLEDDGGVEIADEVVDRRNQPVRQAAGAADTAAQAATKRSATKGGGTQDAGKAGGSAKRTPPRAPHAKR